MKRLTAWLAGVFSSALFGVFLAALIERPRYRIGFGISQGYMEPLETMWWVLAGMVLGVLASFFIFVRRLYAKP